MEMARLMIFKSTDNEFVRLMKGAKRRLSLQSAARITLAAAFMGLSNAPSHAELTELRTSASSSSCEGKLGVHRTIKVSNKNATLVGVDNHGRIGLRPKEVVLTFDDGPRNGPTQKILNALAAECVKATFFSLGRAARAEPALLRRIAREGHTIGSHSQSHPFLSRRNSETVRAEIRRGVNSINAAFEGTNYKPSNFFRYPYLDRSNRTDAIVREMGLVAFHMNIDSWDWREQTSSQMVNLTMSRVRKEGSGVVLFHDVKTRTAVGLPSFLRTLKREGYKIVHIVPGASDFDYRKDLSKRKPAAAEKIQTAKLSPTTDLADQAGAEKAKRTITKKKLVRVPHPRIKPRPTRLTSVERDNLARPTSVVSRQVSTGAIGEPHRKKKRGFLRRLFGKNKKN